MAAKCVWALFSRVKCWERLLAFIEAHTQHPAMRKGKYCKRREKEIFVMFEKLTIVNFIGQPKSMLCFTKVFVELALFTHINGALD